MKPTLMYHMYSASTAFVAGMCQIDLTNKCRIVAVRFSWNGIQGAGGAILHVALHRNQQAVVDVLTNNPSRESMIASASVTTANSAAFVLSTPQILVNVPCQAGDRMTLNGANQGGTAPSSSSLMCDFWIELD